MVYHCGVNLYARILSCYDDRPSKVARAYGVSIQAILNWKKRGVPKGRALDIEYDTKGRITAHDVLREGR